MSFVEDTQEMSLARDTRSCPGQSGQSGFRPAHFSDGRR